MTEPRTYTLTEQQRMLVSEGLAMVAAQRRARQSDWRAPGWGKRPGEGVRRTSRVEMEADQNAELDVLRKMFRTQKGDTDGMGSRDSALPGRSGGSDAGA